MRDPPTINFNAMMETNVSAFEGIVGRSTAIQVVFKQIQVFAEHYRTLLVFGQTGTGKELVAEAVHKRSPRSNIPLVICNCAALPEALLESQLFGHRKGAFTGATTDVVGLFEYASGGAIFLDEIGELTLPAQAKLLRVLQNGEIQKIGSPVPRQVDIRVIAATNRNLAEMVRTGTFREDLYYRLTTFEIHVPPLSLRHGDIGLLSDYFLARLRHKYERPWLGLSARARARLEQYHWPGNVRQLESALDHASVVSASGLIGTEDLPPSLATTALEHESTGDNSLEQAGIDTQQGSFRFRRIDEVVRDYVLQVLDSTNGNRKEAAQILGIGRTTLYRMVQHMKADAEEDSDSVSTGERKVVATMPITTGITRRPYVLR